MTDSATALVIWQRSDTADDFLKNDRRRETHDVLEHLLSTGNKLTHAVANRFQVERSLSAVFNRH